MVIAIQQWLDHIQLGASTAVGPLQVFPLMGDSEPEFRYLLLEQALKKELTEVHEVSKSGSVPELFLLNRSQEYVLGVDGTELKGAKQNRVLNTTVLIGPESQVLIPVSCTEQGRWSWRSEKFESSGNVMFRKGRRNKMERVSEALKSGQGFHSDQQEVWSDISRLQMRMSYSSKTGAMADVFEARKEELKSARASYLVQSGQQGFVVERQGQVLGLEWLSSAQAFEEVGNRLLDSYLLDHLGSVEEEEDNLLKTPDSLLGQIALSQHSVFPGTGVGEEVRLESESIIGAALIWGKEPLHLSVFPKGRTIRKGRWS